MIKYLIIAAVMLVTLPFWLPITVGGDTSYHFVLTDSMKGSLDPGSFVILRRAESYKLGEAVGYKLDVGSGETVTVLHRIVGRLPDGKFLMKGDAVESTEVVEEQAITGHVVLALPALGFLPGAFRAAPMVVGGLLLAVVFLAGGTSDKNKAAKKRSFGKKRGFKKEHVYAQGVSVKASAKNNEPPQDKKQRQYLFFPAAVLVLLSLPFATNSLTEILPPFVAAGGLGNVLSSVPLFALLLVVLGVTRVGEVYWNSGSGSGSGGGSMSEINYAVVMILAVSIIPVTEIMSSMRTVFTL